MRGAGWEKGMGLIIFWLCASILAGPQGARAEAEALKISQESLEIGAFFQGGSLTVTAEIPADTAAVIELVGSAAEQHFLRKGRRAGLWMSVGEVTVTGAPNFYLAMSSSPDLLEADGPEASPFGYQALHRRVKLSGMVTDQEQEKFFREFVKLKESEGLYLLLPGKLQVAATGGNRAKATGVFPLPAKIAPGKYRVILSVVRDGAVSANREVGFTVAMVGFPALLASLAGGHGALYGVIAVVIAIIVGIFMGLLFKGKTGH